MLVFSIGNTNIERKRVLWLVAVLFHVQSLNASTCTQYQINNTNKNEFLNEFDSLLEKQHSNRFFFSNKKRTSLA
jgi:hypothetical protein